MKSIYKDLTVNKLNALRIVLIGMFFMLIGIQANAQSFVLDVQYNAMSFTNAKRTVINDPKNDGGLSKNAVHRYDNVITVNGTTVYAHLTILNIKDATIKNFDDDSQTGDKKRFQPRIGSTKNNKDGQIEYQLEFFNVANDQPVFLYNYWLTGVDIDGGDDKKGKESYREYVEIGGYTSYQVDQSTKLTVTANPDDGTTRFKGRAGSLGGVTFDNTASFIANYSNPNNKIKFTLGITNQKVNERYFSVQFGAPDEDGPFDDPVIIQNPLPVAIDDIGTIINKSTGGTSVENVLDNDLFDGAAINPNDVNISLVTAASNNGVVLNISTGKVTVAQGTPVGTYQLTYKICLKNDASACDLANVTVEVVQLKADVSITKSSSKDEIKPGETFTYTLSVKNNGPGLAQVVKVRDALPSSLNLVEADPEVGSWNAPNWTIGELASGATKTLTLTVTAKLTAAGNIVNTATVSTTSQESNYQNNTANKTIKVNPLRADIEVMKTASKDEIKPGETFNYTITVENKGTDAAQSVKVSDVLPNSLTFVEAIASEGDWNAPNWTIGELTSGATETLTLTVTAKSNAAGNIVNTATASTTTVESDYQNNTSNKTIKVNPLLADVEVLKTASKDAIKPGETFNYTITVENKGTDAAQSVKVSDVLPNSLTFVEAIASEGDWNAPNWTIGELASGATETLTLTVTAKSNAAGNIVNTATASTTTVESDYQNNTSNKTVQVTALSSDVEVVKSASKEAITPGETFSYTITVENKGPDAAQSVKVRDVLPNSLTFVEDNPSEGSWNAPEWSIGELASGATETLVLTVTAKSNAAGNIVNTATVSTTTLESNYQNNTSVKSIAVSQLSADLEITKTASKDQVDPEESFTYTITVKNNGPDAAQSVKVIDNLPNSLNFVGADPSEGNWNAPNWTMDELASGATETMVLTVTAKEDASGNVVNTATVSSNTADPDSDNNSASKTIVVNVVEKSADLEVTKTASKSPVEPGETFTYTVAVKNNGPDAAENVKIADILPSSLDVIEITPSIGNWSAPNWTIGTLANGSTQSITMSVKVNENASGSIVNTATVSSTTDDPNEGNNTASKVVPIEMIELSADLEITKTASRNPVKPGETFSYTISVKNNGPDAASGVSVKDLLPSSLNLIQANVSVGSWNTPDWTIGTLANGVTKTMSLTVSVKGSATGNITNTATVTSSTDDPISNNNSSTKTISVDDNTTITNNFPANGFGTLAFEDLWPGKGDYDFNDLVLDYQFQIVTNTNNKVDQVKGTFIIKAFGATLKNGFGFQLSDNIDASSLNVSGYSLTENFIRLSGNGTESRQTKPTIIVYDNAYNQMQHPGTGIGVNTDPTAPYITPDTLHITIIFPSNVYSFNDLDIANFNPFLIVNLERGVEVHLPDYPPTDLADRSHFKTFADNTNPSAGIYYKTENNLPWAIHIIETFDYPKEKKDITWSHLKFAEWAISGGSSYPDWFKDNSGYRNDSNIFDMPF